LPEQQTQPTRGLAGVSFLFRAGRNGEASPFIPSDTPVALGTRAADAQPDFRDVGVTGSGRTGLIIVEHMGLGRLLTLEGLSGLVGLTESLVVTKELSKMPSLVPARGRISGILTGENTSLASFIASLLLVDECMHGADEDAKS
jgi:hypothetical protein